MTAAARTVARLLAVRGVGPARLRQILARARERGVPIEELSRRLHELGDVLSTAQQEQFMGLGTSDDEIGALENAGVFLVSVLDEVYPERLRDRLQERAPPLLWISGNVGLFSEPTVGFCGSRAASRRGLEVTQDCADQLARSGCVIVSGYAAGVDMQAHRTALEVGRSTVLVLAEGIDHFRIKREIKSVWSSERTCVVSEFPAHAQWTAGQAMQRNRTIVGLSSVMILIEAGATGGSIAAGRTALDLGVPLFAPEYEGMPPSATGNRELLGRGARAVWRSRTTTRAKLDEVSKSPPRHASPQDSFR